MDWLKRLMPFLESNIVEAKCLVAFHFAVEATIKQDQGRTKIFTDIGAVKPLQRVAASNNEIASTFAILALEIIGEDIPPKLSFKISCWRPEEVQTWVNNIGFGSFLESFKKQVDGDLLLTITDDELNRDIDMSSRLLRRRFLRELSQLKINATSGEWELANWLKNLGHEYHQYMHNLIHCGIDLHLLPYVNDEHLSVDAGITNGVHRMKILKAIGEQQGNQSVEKGNGDTIDRKPTETQMPNGGIEPGPEVFENKTLDVFISYRRSGGSQLASLLKVHLKGRDFKVFIDVDKLKAGQFDKNLINSVKNSNNFVLVLSKGALDRCKEDVDGKDWLHREIVAAVAGKCNIVPVFDGFKWPKPEELPEDMRNLCVMNGVTWSHEFQDASMDKLEGFLTDKIEDKPKEVLKMGVKYNWTPQDIAELKDLFKHFLKQKKTPDLNAINKAITKSKVKGGKIWKLQPGTINDKMRILNCKNI